MSKSERKSSNSEPPAEGLLVSLRKSNAESPGVEVDGFSSNTNISSSEGMSIFRLVFCRVTFISGMDCFLGSERWIAGAIAAGGGF